MENIDLSPFCKTKAQANEFLGQLAAMSEKAYETDFNLEKVALDQMGIQKKDSFLQLLSQQNISLTAIDQLKTFLAQLQEMVSKLPVLSLTIAFEPKEESLKAFSDWFFLNVKKQVLFAVTVDRSLIGGATISYNGKHINCSIQPSFEQILTDSLKQPTTQPSEPVHQQNAANLHLGR